jgi:hypothetical protein
MPVILFSRAEPPALIFASLRSLRRRACSAARWAAASLEEETLSVMCAEFPGEKWEVAKRVLGSGEGVMG